MASQAALAPQEGHPQLIVILKDPAKLESAPQDTQSLMTPSAEVSSAADVSLTAGVSAGADSLSVQDILNRHDASLSPIFGPTVERIRNDQAHFRVMSAMSPHHETSQTPKADDLPDLSQFHRVHAPPEKLEQLKTELLAHDAVDAAYIKPPVRPPIARVPAPTPAKAPSTTPNFTTHQIYLGGAPAGIDANYAGTVPGGLGDGVTVIDCEHGWQFTHEDLQTNKGGIVAGTGTTNLAYVDHGTAVAGVISGDDNKYGVTGIAPNATFSASSWSNKDTAKCIYDAAAKLDPGDILLLEGQMMGPAKSETIKSSDYGFLPIEWWPDNLVAIQKAVARGIIVVEAAGNGYQNLDDAIYDVAPDGSSFGPLWKNPLNPQNPSSGAIMVGAGNPPPGTHGQDHGPDRSKCYFSNYGSRVDCQGWGEEVTSTGYGDLQNGSRDIAYTNRFSGTSSASPVVVGALAAVQGVLKRARRPLLNPKRALDLLRTSGSPQQDSPTAPKTQRIGNRPDLRKLIPLVLAK